MVAFRGDGGGNMLPRPGEYRRGKAHRPAVEARVAAAALRLLQAGEPDGAAALLTLVAGDLAPTDPLARRASRARKGGNPARIDDAAVTRPQRPIRAVLPLQDVKMAAAKSFATGEINAIELGRILRGER
jgi:hypothetical protein